MIVKLFSYGTLQQDDVQLSTFKRKLKGTPDAIVGYTTSMLEIKDPVVVATSGKTHHPIVRYSGDLSENVEGTVFEITEAELLLADEYEVSDYRRVVASLRSGGEAWVYIAAGDL
jgi:hypothetical protein